MHGSPRGHLAGPPDSWQRRGDQEPPGAGLRQGVLGTPRKKKKKKKSAGVRSHPRHSDQTQMCDFTHEPLALGKSMAFLTPSFRLTYLPVGCPVGCTVGVQIREVARLAMGPLLWELHTKMEECIQSAHEQDAKSGAAGRVPAFSSVGSGAGADNAGGVGARTPVSWLSQTRVPAAAAAAAKGAKAWAPRRACSCTPATTPPSCPWRVSHALRRFPENQSTVHYCACTIVVL